MKSLRTLFFASIALVGVLASASAQGWVAKYSPGTNTTPTKIKVDSSGNTYVVGTRGTGSSMDILLLKYDTSGTLVWAVTYAGPANGADSPLDMVLDSSGNIYITGSSYRGATNKDDVITLKYNASGVLQWVQAYNGTGNGLDWGSAIALDSSNNVCVAGSARRGSGDIIVLKYDTNGVAQWVQAYNGAGNGGDQGYGIAVDSGDNIIATGYASRGGTNSSDYITLKYDSTGTILWANAYNGGVDSPDVAEAVVVDSSDNVIVTGYSGGAGSLDYVTIKYNSSGVTQWAKRYNGTGNDTDVASALATDAQGNVYVTGYSTGVDTLQDWATVKYNSSGVVQWVKRTRTAGSDSATALFVDSSYNVYVAGLVTGNTSGGTTGTDSYVVKYNSSGTPTFSARYNGAANGDDFARAMTVFGGNIYVAMQSHNGTKNDVVTIKYTP